MKKFRIRKNAEYRVVYKRGRSFSNELLVLYVYNKRSDVSRVGVSVSKKVGKSVIRNKVRRRIYEVYRLNSDKIKQGYDLVFIARNLIKNKSYFEIEKSVINLLNKAGIYVL